MPQAREFKVAALKRSSAERTLLLEMRVSKSGALASSCLEFWLPSQLIGEQSISCRMHISFCVLVVCGATGTILDL